MRRVRCPRCSAIIMADGGNVTCSACGLAGRVDAPSATGAAGYATGHDARHEGRSDRRDDMRGGRRDGGRGGARAARDGRDPWTITIDLRKVSPTNWSPGAKSFAVILLLGFVFVAGGVSGVVFERTRSDVADDLDATSGFFGSRQSDGTGAGTSQPASLAATPDDLDDTTGADGSNVSDPPASSPPPSSDTWRFSGTGTTTIDLPAAIPAGVYKLTISYYNPDGRFLRLQLGNETLKTSVEVSDFGRFTGMVRYVGLHESGKYSLRVATQNGGNWDLDVKYMGATTSSSNSVSDSDKGDKGLGPFRFNGDIDVTFSVSSALSYEVRAIGADGRLVQDCTFTPGASGGDAGTCTFPTQTIVYFDVEIAKDAGTWTLKASQKA